MTKILIYILGLLFFSLPFQWVKFYKIIRLESLFHSLKTLRDRTAHTERRGWPWPDSKFSSLFPTCPSLSHYFIPWIGFLSAATQSRVPWIRSEFLQSLPSVFGMITEGTWVTCSMVSSVIVPPRRSVLRARDPVRSPVHLSTGGQGRGSKGSTGSLWVTWGAEEVLVRRKWWDLCLPTMAPPSSSSHHCVMVSMEEVFGENRTKNLSRAYRGRWGNFWETIGCRFLSCHFMSQVRDMASAQCSLKMGAVCEAWISLQPSSCAVWYSPDTERRIPSLASQRFIDTDTLRKYPSSFSAQWGSAVSRLQADFRQGLSKFRWGLAEYIITLRMCQKYLWLVMISGYCLHSSFMYPQSQYSITHIGNSCEEQGAQNHALRWCPNSPPPSKHMLGYKKFLRHSASEQGSPCQCLSGSLAE